MEQSGSHLNFEYVTHKRMNSDTTLPYEVTVLEKSIYEESNAK